MKKIRFSVLALVLAGAFAFAGCDAMRGSGWNDDPFGDGGSSGGRISIAISSAGYGTDWIQNIMDEYTEATGVRFATLQTDPINGNLASQVANGNAATDIVITVGGMFRAQSNGMLEDLSGVYAATPEGESEPISEKTNRSVYERLLTDDGIYQMSWINGAASIIYNKTYIDGIAARDANDELGADWEENLPRTTDELNEFARKIYAAGGVPFICSPNISYYDYLRLVWWAQYSGLETYRDFYRGYYTNASGERVPAENAEVLNDPGRLISMEAAGDLFGTAGWFHSDSVNLDFEAAQRVFLQNVTPGVDETGAAMMVCGDWMENEMRRNLNGQEIRMMRVPVIGDIVDNLPDKSVSREQLATAVQCIDDGDTLEQAQAEIPGLTLNDYTRLQEARRMVYSSAMGHMIAIPANRPEENKQRAKDFLIYLCSDGAQAVFSETLNGLTMPYGYTPETSMVSGFAASRIEAYGSDAIFIEEDGTVPMAYLGNLMPYGDYEYRIDGMQLQGQSASEIMNLVDANLRSNWSSYFRYHETNTAS